MVIITDKIRCCGCTACEQVCPMQCIHFFEDEEGFLYPLADDSSCIKCGLCEKVCPVINKGEESLPLKTYAAINEDISVRKNSSSGGVFYLLAEQIINKNGVVFGARFDNNWMVVTEPEDTLDGVKLFRGSKYLQSNLNDSFKHCEILLKEGRHVLFSGTPCQIVGLKNYLRNDYENLITVDFVCHGVPSPGIWKRYIAEVTSMSSKTISDIKFRDKKNGWRKFSFVINCNEDGKNYSISSLYSENLFMKAFLCDLILRPSCYQCPVKCGRSHSDITIGDLWGAEHIVPAMDDDQGISLVMVNSSKGIKLVKQIDVRSESIEYADACKYNTAIFQSSNPHFRRSDFFSNLDKSQSICNLIQYNLRPTFLQRLSLIKLRVRNLFK